MSGAKKQLSNPFSTGGGGEHFEAHVQASFVLLMLTGGFAPCMPNWPIIKIKLQGKFAGFDTDDLIIFLEKPGSDQKRKILAQIKHSISITENDKVFGEVVQAAWNDFNNDELFTKGEDVIALITGPLSATDINDVRTILEWARHSENAEEFFNKVELAKFSSKKKQEKLQAFKTNLTKANGGIEVPDEVLFDFLRHFHLLGYDLDVKAGVTLSLLHSLIGQFSQENASSLWARIVDEVQSANKNAGTLSPEDISEDLRTAFLRRVGADFPEELSQVPSESVPLDLNKLEYASDLALANLLGSWDENNEADREVISQLSKKDYSSWITEIRDILQQPGSPINLKNGKWRVTKRLDMWQVLGARLFDDNLDAFKECLLRVLCEQDPRFDLPEEERSTASINGKVLEYSPDLRKGLVETLALLGNYSDDLSNCSQNKAETLAALAVREILANTDYKLWGSLDNLLPVLAEAAPEEFLDAVEKVLQKSPCPFDELFSQESDGLFGRNYLVGLLWALETLAWEEQFLIRVCVILGELAAKDPGGNSGNRPANSLTTILLPWIPRTTASIEKRKVALQTLKREVPEIAWKLIISMLPTQTRTSFDTSKPKWRNVIPEDWKEGVTKGEYWEQVYHCAELAVDMAKDDMEKLNELVRNLDDLPKPSFEKVLELLSSGEMTSKPEEERLPIWTELTDFVLKHRRFADADWALSAEIVSSIEVVADKLAPKNPMNLYIRLFSYKEHDLFEEKGNYEEQRQRLEELRQQAIREILDYGGMEAVIRFAKSVESPSHVGHSLGVVAEAEVDKIVLPALLDPEDKKLIQFVGGYVWSRRYGHGWEWVDGLDKTDWSVEQKSQLLSLLPFTAEAWDRAATWLGESENEYWINTSVNPYQSEGDLSVAIDKLIQYDRPHAAIDCIDRMRHDKQPLDINRSVKALLEAVSSTEPSHAMDAYHIVEIIKALQDDPEIDPDDLFRVEWAYLPLLDRHRNASPQLLEKRLASDPTFFCEVIRLLYRSKKEEKSDKEPTEQEQAVATQAWRMLHGWQTPPGTQPDGSFSHKHLKEWLDYTKAACAESGHLEVALNHVGEVLYYSPPDPDGLWIDKGAAEVLNDKDAGKMRRGFSIEAFNSRGAHSVDPTGKPERDLSQRYRQKAEDVENAGYQRFAATLRKIAESYDREAERIIAEHKAEATEDNDDE
jgi:hypothetical protein